VTKVLLEAGASLSAVDNDVIKFSVKLRQCNINLISDEWGMSSKMKKIKYLIFLTNLFKINIFWFSSITRLKPVPIRFSDILFSQFLKLFNISFLDPDMKKIYVSSQILLKFINLISDEWGMSSKMKKIKYLKCRVGSCSNRVIELNLEMLILARFVTKHIFFSCQDQENCRCADIADRCRGVRP
jgi:hypothetical protein